MKRQSNVAAVLGLVVIVIGAGLSPGAQAQGVISINFASDVELSSGAGPTSAVGTQTAGVVSAGHWNDVPLAQQTNLSLVDQLGNVVPGLLLSTTEMFSYPDTAFDAPGVAFANAGDTAMMRGHIYHGEGGNTDLSFSGTIPYAQFDLIAYYNSGGIANQQTFSILDSQGGSLQLSKKGAETPGGDTSFVMSNTSGTNNANYVVISQIDRASIPTNFMIRASGDDYSYFNGLQIVEASPPPPPPVLLPGHLWDVSQDYSVEQNPNPNNFGAWSYGRIDYGPDGDPTTQLDTFTLYDENGQMIDIFQAWQDSGPGTVDTLGGIAFNPDERDAKFGITLDPMEVDFIPDQSNQVVSTVKFTAPVDGKYNVHAEFQDNQTCCANREGDAWVFSDPDGELFHIDKLLGVDGAQQDDREGVETYDGVVTLTAGQAVYFASGKGVDVGGGDHVDLRATVMLTGVAGDFDGNGMLDAADIDLLSADVRAGTNSPQFDVNGDTFVDATDREVWVGTLRITYFGDSNLDGEFNSGDLVAVLAAGEYEDAIELNSGWEEGDFNGDGDVTTADLVVALADGGYEQGPRAAVSAVPEPSTLILALCGGFALVCRRWRN